MKIYDPKDEITLQQMRIVRDPWEAPSRCNRPPMKRAPSLLDRIMTFLGIKK